MSKTKINIRSQNDEQWQELKIYLKKRDKSCRVAQCLSISEAKFANHIEGFVSRLDCAHMFSAGNFPALIYNKNNCYRISHTFHERLDSYKDPLTGDFIDRNEWAWWWWRISSKSTEKYEKDTNYEYRIRELVGLPY
jgi:hypothetical protein